MLGIRHALATGAEQVLLMNNDTTVDRFMVERLVAHTSRDVGLVAPLIFYDEPARFDLVCRRSAQPLDAGAAHTSRSTRPAGLASCHRTRFCTRMCHVAARAMLEVVGLFDERFFMYYEDSDLCLRIQRVGFRLLLVPGAECGTRSQTSSGGADSAAERYHMARSSVLFFRKYVGQWRWAIVAPYRLGSAVKTIVRLWTARAWHCRTGLLARVARRMVELMSRRTSPSRSVVYGCLRGGPLRVLLIVFNQVGKGSIGEPFTWDAFLRSAVMK